MKLSEVFKNTDYTYTLFSEAAVDYVENSIVLKDNRGVSVPYITCQIRQKEIKLTPEESVRQLYIFDLINNHTGKRRTSTTNIIFRDCNC